MLENYFAILVFLLFSFAVAVVARLVGYLLGPQQPNKAKVSVYECGFDGIGDARLPFDVRFYLVAILFIVFDLETAFLFPWALVMRHVGHPAFIAMMIFLLILVVGFIYEWCKGAIEWE